MAIVDVYLALLTLLFSLLSLSLFLYLSLPLAVRCGFCLQVVLLFQQLFFREQTWELTSFERAKREVSITITNGALLPF